MFDFKFDYKVDEFLDALRILGIGWGGIFIVMAILFLVIMILLRALPPKENEDQ